MATEEFSYQADIEPIRGKLINGKSQSAFEYERTLDKQHQLNILDIQEAGRNRQLAFQKQMKQLEDDAKATRDTADAILKIPEIMAELEAAARGENPAEEIAKSASRNAPSIASSPVIKTMYDSALLAENARTAQRAERAAFGRSVTDNLTRVGVEATKKFISSSNISDEEKSRQLQIVDARAAELKEASKSGYEQEQQKARFTSENSILDGYSTTLNAMKFQDVGDAGDDTTPKSLKEGNNSKKPAAPPKPRLIPSNKVQVIEILVDLNPDYETDEGMASLKKLDDADLYQRAQRSVTAQRRKRDSNTFPPETQDLFNSKLKPE